MAKPTVDEYLAMLTSGTAEVRVNGVLVNGPAKASPASKKPAKYRSTKTEIDGYTFDSKKESNRYLDLREEQRAGTITALERQPSIPCIVNGNRVCDYVADFRYRRDGELIYEDVKSSVTKKLPLYRLKIKLVLALYGIRVREL